MIATKEVIVYITCTAFTIVYITCTSFTIVYITCTSFTIFYITCTAFTIVYITCTSFTIVYITCTSFTIVYITCTSLTYMCISCVIRHSWSYHGRLWGPDTRITYVKKLSSYMHLTPTTGTGNLHIYHGYRLVICENEHWEKVGSWLYGTIEKDSLSIILHRKVHSKTFCSTIEQRKLWTPTHRELSI